MAGPPALIEVDQVPALDPQVQMVGCRAYGLPLDRSEEGNLRTKVPPVHPGEILLEEFLKPMGLSQYRLAKDIGVPAHRINEIVHGQRAISADTALRLSRFFSMSERFWLNLQARYELEVEPTSGTL
jgi:addiction module HigA family antidote